MSNVDENVKSCGQACALCKTFVCAWCHRPRPYDQGCADELFDMCDDCAVLFLPLFDDDQPTAVAA